MNSTWPEWDEQKAKDQAQEGQVENPPDRFMDTVDPETVAEWESEKPQEESSPEEKPPEEKPENRPPAKPKRKLDKFRSGKDPRTGRRRYMRESQWAQIEQAQQEQAEAAEAQHEYGLAQGRDYQENYRQFQQETEAAQRVQEFDVGREQAQGKDYQTLRKEAAASEQTKQQEQAKATEHAQDQRLPYQELYKKYTETPEPESQPPGPAKRGESRQEPETRGRKPEPQRSPEPAQSNLTDRITSLLPPLRRPERAATSLATGQPVAPRETGGPQPQSEPQGRESQSSNADVVRVLMDIKVVLEESRTMLRELRDKSNTATYS